MFHLISIIKSLVITIFIVLLLQVKVGNDTIEDKAVFWFRSSPLVQPIQKVVDGGVKVIQTSLGGVLDLFDFKWGEKIAERPGTRDVKFRMERSQQFLKEKAENVARKMEQQINQQQQESTEQRSNRSAWE